MNKTLKQGSRGPYVEYLQNILNKLGLGAGAVDGSFGNRTEQAVIRFQKDIELVPDGIVGPLTWQALDPYLKGFIRYIIKAGDMYYNLSRQFNTSINALIAANPSLNTENLQVGQEMVIPFIRSTIPTDISYCYEIMQLNIASLKVHFPFLEVGVVGRSVLGNDITYIKIGTGPKEVFYNAAHHANEWITSVVLMKYIEQFSNAYVNGEKIGGSDSIQIYNETTTYIIPMVNPDGVNLVAGCYEEGSPEYRRALLLNVPSIPFPSGWTANIKGVDLNLNYPAGWDRAKAQKFALGYTSPRPFGYVGPAPLSEPESRAIVEFTRSHNFSLTLAYHSQGEIIFWKYLNYLPPHSLQIAYELSSVSGYAVEETPIESGYAGYKDWFIQEYNRPGYTIEVGIGVNPLPITQFSEIYKDNIGILTQVALLS